MLTLYQLVLASIVDRKRDQLVRKAAIAVIESLCTHALVLAAKQADRVDYDSLAFSDPDFEDASGPFQFSLDASTDHSESPHPGSSDDHRGKQRLPDSEEEDDEEDENENDEDDDGDGNGNGDGDEENGKDDDDNDDEESTDRKKEKEEI